MSIQEMPAFENGLGYMSNFKLMEYPDKIRIYLENEYSEVFKDPWNDWDKIRRVFGTFGTYKSQENASFSKHPDQGDSSKGQFMLNFHSDGVLIQMYEIAKKLDILIDPDEVEITYKVPPTPKEQENLTKWRTLAIQYEKIIDIETTMVASAFAMAPLMNQEINPYMTDIWVRSPVQMKLYNSYLTGTTITLSERYGGDADESCINRVPWETTNAICSSMMGTLLGDWWYNLIAEPIVNVNYEKVIAPLYHITLDDITNEYFEFQNNGDYVVQLEYAIKLPEDSTSDVSLELKTCYGETFGQSLLYPCDVCDYTGGCQAPDCINPSLIDYFIRNRIRWIGEYAGQRIKIKYKKVYVVT